MKNKEKLCPECGIKMKYKGSRLFVCKKCGKRLEYERVIEPRREKWGG
jgi:tRNA(Ile2) C34 agmatinyltransferase TiaS